MKNTETLGFLIEKKIKQLWYPLFRIHPYIIIYNKQKNYAKIFMLAVS